MKTARAHAAFEERTAITDRDIAIAAELALTHRIKRGRFHQSEISMDELQDRIEQLQGASLEEEGVPEPAQDTQESAEKKKTL